MRTREEMAAIIRSGRSVYGPDGVLYTDVALLPSEASLALGNKQAESAARENIEKEMARLKSELALLEAAKVAESADVPVEEAKVEDKAVEAKPVHSKKEAKEEKEDKN